MDDLRFGLTLSNRDVVLGRGTADDLLRLAERADASGLFGSVWVGDSLYVNPRLDSLTLLAAIAGRTRHVLLGPACMGSFALRDPLVFAYEWASLDHIANGRTVLIACAGGGAGPAWEAESRALGVPAAQRRRRMMENIAVLRHLWTVDDEPFDGEFHRFAGLRLRPRPVQDPPPVWLATNTGRLSGGPSASDPDRVPTGLRRVAHVADGWMTHSVTPDEFADSWQLIRKLAAAEGRDPEALGNCLYHNIHVGAPHAVALDRARAYLDEYYATTFSRERTAAWTTAGTADECVEGLRAYRGSGVQHIALRLCADDQEAQLEQLITDVLPHVNG